MNYILEDLGFHEYFKQLYTSYYKQGFSVGRIAQESKSRYVVLTEQGTFAGEVTGKLLFTSENAAYLPKVGDWVIITIFEHESKVIIHQVLPRKTCFSRKIAGNQFDEQIIAANIDLIFIVQSLDHSFNLRRLERYLVMAHESGAQPIIILNKADLCSDIEVKLSEVKQIAGTLPIVVLSCLEENVEDKLSFYLQPGATIAFTGSSGVGKSTLINKLAGQQRQGTGPVRSLDSKGRHTTTHRELIPLENGVILVDTPGMRELQLWQADNGLQEAFSNLTTLAEQCRFSDCKHNQEKGCAIKEAVLAGEVSQERYTSFMKLQKELAHLLTKTDKASFLAHKNNVKKVHRQMKKNTRNR
jgi:ribosome biogenesis GTPase